MKPTNLLMAFAVVVSWAGGWGFAGDKTGPTVRITPRGSVALSATELVSCKALAENLGEYVEMLKKRYGDPPEEGLRIELASGVELLHLRVVAGLGRRVGFPDFIVVSGPYQVQVKRDIDPFDGELRFQSKFISEDVKNDQRVFWAGRWYKSKHDVSLFVEICWHGEVVEGASGRGRFDDDPFSDNPKRNPDEDPFRDKSDPFGGHNPRR